MKAVTLPDRNHAAETARELLAEVSALTREVRERSIEPRDARRRMHAVLVVAVEEGVRGTRATQTGLFAQTALLCAKYGFTQAEEAAIQRMRKHSNEVGAGDEPLEASELLADLQALGQLVRAVYAGHKTGDAQPGGFRTTDQKQGDSQADTLHCLATTEEGEEIRIDYSAHDYLRNILHEGMTIGLTGTTQERAVISRPDAEPGDDPSRRTVRPRLIVVEPDYLVDISRIARLFTEWGHHPLQYTLNRMLPTVTTQAILLGSYSDQALDDIIHSPRIDWTRTLRTCFRTRATDFCCCEDLNAKEDFKEAAQRRSANLTGIVQSLFGEREETGEAPYDRSRAILEPTLIAPMLGLQGRVDLMTTDLRLLVEQKSGSNWNIECGRKNRYGGWHKEDHYVQLLLYAAVLRQARRGRLSRPAGGSPAEAGDTDMYLLYSRYAAPQGLVAVNFYQALYHEAMRLRNRVVAYDFMMAERGFDAVLPHLQAERMATENVRGRLWQEHVRPQLERALTPLHSLSPLERAYFTTMATFTYREQIAGKVGSHEGAGSSAADLWNMPLPSKRETGNIYTALRISDMACSREDSGYDLITLSVPWQGDDFLPNFRAGDTVYLYHYEGEPLCSQTILYRGTLASIHTDRVTVHLSDGQQDPHILPQGLYAIEHAATDTGYTAALRSLYAMMTAPRERRDLLLCQREPETDPTLRLSHPYHPHYDEILTRVKQARDLFLLVGPPGTGKTSMALRYMVEEALTDPAAKVLLLSYTNRAVDEICGMLEDASLPYLRIGSPYSCDPRYRSRLLANSADSHPRLAQIRSLVTEARITVATTSTMQGRAALFPIAGYTLAIVDEAGQILEPGLVGLLTLVPKFVLIGDYKQLPAVVQQDPALSLVTDPLLRETGFSDCRVSLFERLYRHELRAGRGQCVGVLRRQGRMHPAIARFPNDHFYSREQLECVPLPHQSEEHIYERTVRGDEDDMGRRLLTRRLIFFPADEEDTGTQPSDKVSAGEARIVARTLARVYAYSGPHFDADHTVGVIVPYRAQIAMIRSEVERLHIPALAGVSIDTVERYQGSQRDVIIYSTTISHVYQLRFLTASSFVEDGHVIDRKLNVAITRARKQLILTGCERVLRHDPLYAALIESGG